MLTGMQRWIAAALVAAGCYRSSPPPPPPPTERPRPAYEEPPPPSARYRPPRPATPARSAIGEALVKLNELTNDMCACTDRTCADAVQQELTRWSEEMSKDRDAYEKPTEEELEEATRVTQRLSSCMMTAMGHGPPPPPPSP